MDNGLMDKDRVMAFKFGQMGASMKVLRLYKWFFDKIKRIYF